jgi:SAM-dependent methyltransferase
MVEFEQLLAEGLRLDVEAYWGAGLLPERLLAESPSWSYPAMARSILSSAQSALDMGTGEGGVLARLAPLPRLTVAYEGWWPTVPAAQERLKPLGVHLVVALGSPDNVVGPDLQRRRSGLPFCSDAFDVILNRHEAFDPFEIRRIIKPGGRFLTQQVGSDEAASVRTLLGLPVDRSAWAAALAIDQLQPAGWTIDDAREDRLTMRFADIAALIGYVRTIPWAYRDLDWATVRPRLQQLHAKSQSDPIEAISHRFVVLAGMS